MATAKLKEKEKKQAAAIKWLCKCGTEFLGPKTKPKCPLCGEEFDLKPLNEDGLPLGEVKRAINDELIDLTNTNQTISEIEAMAGEEFRRLLNDNIRARYIEKSKAQLLEEQARRIEAEKRLEMLKTGERIDQTSPATITAPPSPQFEYPASGISASMFINSLAKMPKEERDEFLKMLSEDPNIAISLGLMLNPPTMRNMMPPYYGYIPPPSAGSGGGSIKDIADAMKTVVDTSMTLKNDGNSSSVETLIGSLKEELHDLKEALTGNKTSPYDELAKIVDIVNKLKPKEDESNELKEELKAIKDKIYGLQVDWIDKQTQQKQEIISALKEEIKSKVGGGGGGGAPDLEQELNHITAVLDSTEKLHQKLQPKTVESFEEWQKKHTIISEEEKEKRAHEEKIKELEAKKTKHETVAALINAAMMQALNAVNQKREKRTQEQAVAEEKEKALLSELKAEFEQQPEEKEEGK